MTKRARKKSPETTGMTVKPPVKTRPRKPRKPASQIATSSSTKLSDPDDLGDSFFWPELSAEAQRRVAGITNAAEQTKLINAQARMRQFRLEARAVKEKWMIPDAARERMIHDAAKVMLDPTISVRERLCAIQLLKAMDDANKTKDELPPQERAPVNVTINISQLIDEYAKVPIVMNQLDLRDFKPDAGQDYAD